MRVLIDVLGATADSGGMRLYASEVINSWLEAFPEDDLVILGAPWAAREFADHPRTAVTTWRNDSTISRAFGQLAVSAWRLRESKADVLISLSPMLSPFLRRNSGICVVHDWRHLRNPGEVGGVQRAYRRLWQVSVNRAGYAACISDKTLEETTAVCPKANIRLVENGGDHPRRWDVTQERATGPRQIVTFGHHSNKRPALVLEAFSQLPAEVISTSRLHIIGARGRLADALGEFASELGVAAQVTIEGFVSDEVYRGTVASASAIVLASSDEGFGLPIAEAAYFGIPAVVTVDSGVSEMHGNQVISADATATSIADAILTGLSRGSGVRASRRNWSDVAADLRALASDLAGVRHDEAWSPRRQRHSRRESSALSEATAESHREGSRLASTDR